jgi:hypothetical protein
MHGMAGRIGGRRAAFATIAAAVLLGACSGGDTAGGTTAATGAAGTTAAPDQSAGARAGATAKVGSGATGVTTPPHATAPETTAPDPVELVEVQVGVGPTTAELARQVDPAELDDPFGTYAACSGLNRTVGVWALQISDPAAELTAVSILTVPPVTGPGEFAAAFRLEWANDAAVDAIGSVHLDADLQAGTFSATDFDIHGSFRCAGAPSPEPLGEAAREVYALLQRGPQQRVVSLAAPAAATETCPTAVAGPVELSGPTQAGSITRFALGTTPPSLTIRVGDTDLALDPAATVTDLGPGSGTFHAETVDGTVIDGAYRCR